MKGGCEVACDAPDGALFCDGQYLAVSDLPACLEYLATNFKIEVKGSASASASASSAGCSVADGPAASLGWLSAAFGALTLLGTRRRRR
jgi:MYXO-CTERM domain-containing protein